MKNILSLKQFNTELESKNTGRNQDQIFKSRNLNATSDPAPRDLHESLSTRAMQIFT